MACANRCAQECLIISRPSSESAVRISTSQSFVITSEASTLSPEIFPATADFAKPGPISAASSSIVRGSSKSLFDLSGVLF